MHRTVLQIEKELAHFLLLFHPPVMETDGTLDMISAVGTFEKFQLFLC